ncbi:MAG TPA: glycine zipper 2TM domain-containing protein, partial [Arenimonas sp.]|nr:glycine zipper 2TM domain-containing protein [Arenimonas sp.]
MSKFAFTTLAFALGTMSFAALANHPNDNRYEYDDDYYNNQQYDNQKYNSNNGNDGFIHSGRYYNYDQYNPYNQGRYVKAKVVHVVPITQRVSNQRQVVCQPVVYPRYENQPYGSYQSKPIINGGTVTGAVIGGVIGNQVANGSNKTAGTVIGATIGGIVGNVIAQNANHNNYNNGHANNCYAAPGRYAIQTVGYDVTYRYKGRNYLVRMPYYPEKHVRIRLDNL